MLTFGAILGNYPLKLLTEAKIKDDKKRKNSDAYSNGCSNARWLVICTTNTP